MRESIGSTFLYNIVFIFIIIVMGLLTATMNYYKCYKANTMILKAISNNSGYNKSSIKEINRILSGIGYNTGSNINQSRCPRKQGYTMITSEKALGGSSSYYYCVYYNQNDKNSREKKNNYYSYGVTTFIYVELPIVGQFRIPVFTKGERIYRFTEKQ